MKLEHQGFTLGDLLHLAQIVVLLMSIGMAYEKFEATAEAVTVHTQQLNRIEHYLSSRDKDYWKRTDQQ